MADEYKSLTHSAQSIDNTITGLGTHVADTTIHVTAQNKTDWNNKQSALTTEQLAAVNSGITAKKLAEDEAALTEVVDKGAKNFAQTESGSETQYVRIKCTVPAGTYKVYFASLTSTDTDATDCQIYFQDSQSIVSSRGSINRGTGVASNDITVNSDAEWVWIYASDSLSHSSGDTVSFSGAMCCTKAEWDVSNVYVPYAPTNKELYESKVDKARTSISSNSNLNDYKQVGHFKVTSSSIASSITNSPFTTSGYTLDVDYWYQVLSDTTGCIQTAVANVANNLTEKKRIYQYQNGEWSWTQWVTIYNIAIPT